MDTRASSITLHVQSATLKSVAEELAKQSGNRITVNPYQDPNQQQPTVTLNLDSQPFFSVLDLVCDQTGCNFSPGQGGMLVVSPPFSYSRPLRESVRASGGPVKLIADRLDHVNVLTADQGAADYCELELRGIAEPRLNILYYSNASLATQAVDENGTSLAPPAGTSLDDPRTPNQAGMVESDKHIVVTQRGISQFLAHHVILKIPPSAGRHIKHLAGTFSFGITTQNQTVELTDFHGTNRAPVMTDLSNGLKLALGGQSANANSELGIGLIRSGGSDDQWESNERLLQNAEIQTIMQDGTTTIQENGGQSWSSKEHWIWISADRQSLAKIIVKFPVGSTRVDMPFAFDDLPMP